MKRIVGLNLINRIVMLLPLILLAIFWGTCIPVHAEQEGYFTYTINNGEAQITKYTAEYTGDLVDVIIPGTIGGVSVTSIGGDGGFADANNIASVVLPESVTNIEANTFGGNRMLERVSLPSGIRSIGDDAFRECESLSEIILPEGITKIGAGAFGLCGLTNVFIPKSVTSLGLDSNEMKYGSFFGCKNLLNITVDPDNPTYASSGGALFDKQLKCLYEWPGGLKDVNLPGSVISIGDLAIFENELVTNITLPEGITSIGLGAISNCKNLKNISLPKSLTTLSVLGTVGEECPNLTSITVADENPVYASISGALYNKEKTALEKCPEGLEEFVLPDSVTNINNSAFGNCEKLRYITVGVGNPIYASYVGALYSKDMTRIILCPEGKETITLSESLKIVTEYSFSGTKVKFITLPKSVEKIEAFAFNGGSIQKIKFRSDTTDILDDGYGNAIQPGITIVGHDASTAHEYAKKYGNHFELLEDQKAIIVLPGFMGSQLYGRDDNPFWVNKDLIIADAYVYKKHNLSLLSRNSDGSGTESELTSSWKDDLYGIGYEKLIKRLEEDCSEDYDVFFYPYNWAGDLNDALSDLDFNIHFSEYDQVTFVTHSTGGLLAAAYIASSDENKNKVDKVIMIAAPLYGTYDSYNAIETGTHPVVNETIKGIADNDLVINLGAEYLKKWVKNGLRNSPTAYQLFPSNQLLTQCPITIKDANGKDTQVMTLNYLSFQLESGGDTNMNYNLLNGNNRSAQYFRENTLKGDVVKTLQEVDTLLIGSSYCAKQTCYEVGYKKNIFGTPELKNYWFNNAGDGTVYYKSAFGLKKDNIHRLKYLDFGGYKYNHNELASQDTVLDYIVEEIKHDGEMISYGQITPLPTFSTTTENEDMGMMNEIKYNIQSDQPFDIKITDSSNTVIASVIDGFDTGMEENQFMYQSLTSSETENSAILYVPNTGVNVTFYVGEAAGTAVNFTADVSTLDYDGYDSATSTYTANTTREEGLILSFNQLSVVVDKSNLGNLIDGKTTPPTIKPTDWSVPESTKLELNEMKAMEVTGTEAETVKNSLTWDTSDESIVVITDAGELTAKNYGVATISATDGNKVVTSQITVKCQPQTVELADFEVYVGKRNLLEPVFSPVDTTETQMTYQTENTDIISIDENGVVIGLKSGTATVIATTDNGITDTFVVTVKERRPLIGISFDQDTLGLKPDETKLLTVVFEPANTTEDKTITWTTSDENIARVDNSGNITAISVGQAVITATIGTLTATCNVNVSTINMGDVDGNGKIQAYDALMALQIATGKKTGTAEEITTADVDKSGSVEAYDALKILQYSTGKITAF